MNKIIFKITLSGFISLFLLLGVPSPSITKEIEKSEYDLYRELDGVDNPYILEEYVSKIREKVYKNWLEPITEEHNKEVLISFYLFPKGNIDKPILKRSSGVKQLDSLAIQAILDSDPFPPFPQEVKFSNLSITIKFKYIPEESHGENLHADDKKKNKELESPFDNLLTIVEEKERKFEEFVKNQKNAKIEKEREKLALIEESHLKTKSLYLNVQDDIKMYLRIVDSDFGKDLKKLAWETLVSLYPDLTENVPEDRPELLIEKVQNQYLESQKELKEKQELFEKFKLKVLNENIEIEISASDEQSPDQSMALSQQEIGPIYYPVGNSSVILQKKSIETSKAIVLRDESTWGNDKERWKTNNDYSAIDLKTELIWMTRDFRNIEGRSPGSWEEVTSWVKKINDRNFCWI